MKRTLMSLISCLLFTCLLSAQERRMPGVRKNVPLDSIVLSDPFILADAKTKLYYMTGTDGAL